MKTEFTSLEEYLNYDFPYTSIPDRQTALISGDRVIVESRRNPMFKIRYSPPLIRNFVISGKGSYEGKIIEIDREFYLVSYTGNDYREICWVNLIKL